MANTSTDDAFFDDAWKQIKTARERGQITRAADLTVAAASESRGGIVQGFGEVAAAAARARRG